MTRTKYIILAIIALAGVLVYLYFNAKRELFIGAACFVAGYVVCLNRKAAVRLIRPVKK